MSSIDNLYAWIGFNVFVVAALLFDLFVLHKEDKPVSKREALGWTVVWIVAAMVFAGGLAYFTSAEKSLEFVAGYLIEKSLSVDNLFVFMLVFTFFKVPANVQHRVLFWGIFGAIVMRGLMIWLGVALINRFEPIILVFAAVLLYSGVKLLFDKEEEGDLSDNRIVRIARRLLPVTDSYEGSKFLTVQNGVKKATPLLLVLLVVEMSDVVFAVDSIPAVFGVSRDPFIVYTSNIFAILGLRSLYFALAGALAGLRFLKPCLALVLVIIGCKMVAAYFGYHLPVGIALGIVGGLLGAGVALSLLFPKKEGPDPLEALIASDPSRQAREEETRTEG